MRVLHVLICVFYTFLYACPTRSYTRDLHDVLYMFLYACFHILYTYGPVIVAWISSSVSAAEDERFRCSEVLTRAFLPVPRRDRPGIKHFDMYKLYSPKLIKFVLIKKPFFVCPFLRFVLMSTNLITSDE